MSIYNAFYIRSGTLAQKGSAALSRENISNKVTKGGLDCACGYTLAVSPEQFKQAETILKKAGVHFSTVAQ